MSARWRTRTASLLVAAALAQLACACASDDAADGGGPDQDASTSQVAFSDLYQDVLRKRCADVVCHGGGAGKLDMTTRDKAYAALVGPAAAGPDCKSSGLARVVAGKPDKSLLYQKVAGTPSCGRRMPLGGMLDEASVAKVHDWIAAGAHDD